MRSLLLVALAAALPGHVCAQSGTAQRADTTTNVSAQLSDHETGEPISGALVRLITGAGNEARVRTRVTNQQGGFFFSHIPTGRYLLLVSRLGYVSLRDSVAIPAGEEVRMRLQLSSQPLLLQPVVVVVHNRRSTPGPVPGLAERERRGIGTILTRQKIDDEHAFAVSDILRTVSGVRLAPNQDLGYDIELRGGCKPAIWVDGAPTSARDLDMLLQPSDLQAVEVYQAGEVPVRFIRNRCGAVLFWTRPAEGSMRFGSFWKKIFFPAAIIVAMIIRFG